jgi:hypothetical protein
LSGEIRVNAEIRDLNRSSGIAARSLAEPGVGGSMDAVLRAIAGR